jgi:hypothetical protein
MQEKKERVRRETTVRTWKEDNTKISTDQSK